MSKDPSYRILCVGRHQFLSDHIARFFTDIGMQTATAVGLQDAVKIARRYSPDVVICDYDLLATLPLETWEQDELLSRTAVIAVSLTRRPTELHLLDVNGIAGFLYLPKLDATKARQLLHAAAERNRVRLPASTVIGAPIAR